MRDERALSLSGVFMEKIYLGFSSKSSDVPMVEESMRPCPEGTLCLEFLFLCDLQRRVSACFRREVRCLAKVVFSLFFRSI